MLIFCFTKKKNHLSLIMKLKEILKMTLIKNCKKKSKLRTAMLISYQLCWIVTSSDYAKISVLFKDLKLMNSLCYTSIL